MSSSNSLFLNSDKSKEFIISMTNKFINTKTGEIYTTSLKTKYIRSIYYRPMENLAFIKYVIVESSYREKNNEGYKKWSFARGFEFYNAIYALKDKSNKKMLLEESKSEKPFETIEESFNRLPKLPSVFLLMMQVFDILAFDSFVSFIHSEEELKDNTNKFIKVIELSNQSINMSIGGDFKQSNFVHGNFYMSYLGESHTYEIFDYYAEDSDVIFENVNSKVRKNKSLYSGKILLSKEDGDLYQGYMHELIVPIDGTSKVISREVYEEEILQ